MKIQKINRFYYIILIITFLIYVLPPSYKFGVYSLNYLGYFLLVVICVLLVALITLLALQIKKYGFFKGTKETSLNVFCFLIAIICCWFITKTYKKEFDKIEVEIVNLSKGGISNIKLIGRNSFHQVDTLSPLKREAFLFYGKNPKRKLKNDYENELSLRFYFDNKWREKEILKEFGRWRVLKDKMLIRIFSGDSVEVTTRHK
ncbi:hypothetical protein [Flagellimonas sp.]|uniref:hypothetical protein n=1 Tax=Flagellimonas sp. TaxID=2058762 RepID=UPI003AB24DE1